MQYVLLYPLLVADVDDTPLGTLSSSDGGNIGRLNEIVVVIVVVVVASKRWMASRLSTTR